MAVMQRWACVKSVQEIPDIILHVLSGNDLELQIGVNKILPMLSF